MNGYLIIAIAAGCLVLGFLTGYHERTLRYEAAQDKSAIINADKAANAQAQIITKTQIVTKYIHDSKDTCINKPVDTNLLRQLK